MQWWHVYLFTRVDTIHVAIALLWFVSMMFMVGSIIGVSVSHTNKIGFTEGGPYWNDWDMWNKYWKKLLKYVAPVFIITSLIDLALPTQKELAAIILLPKMANSETVKEMEGIPLDATKLLRAKLQEYLQYSEIAKEKAAEKVTEKIKSN